MNLNTRLILIFAGIFMPLLSIAQYYGNYSYRKKLTLNTTTYVSGNADLSNFPVLLSIKDDDLIRTGAITDKLKSAIANDIAFTDATSDQTSELNYQLESYDAATGTLKVWVRIPTLKKSIDNTLYLYFGSPTPLAHPAASGTWTSDYKAVYHFNESTYSTAAGAILDGTDQGKNATLTSSSNNLTSGFIGGAYLFDGATKIVSTGSFTTPNTSFTLSAWIKASSLTRDQKIVTNQYPYADPYAQELRGRGFKMGIYRPENGSDYKAETEVSGKGDRNSSGGFSLNTNQWYYIQSVYSVSSHEVITYINGVYYRSGWGGTATADGLNLKIGVDESGEHYYFNGLIDEVRVSDVAKSADWIKTEYNNQAGISNKPFIATGSLEVLSTPPSVPTDLNAAANSISEITTNGSSVEITAASTPNRSGVSVTYYLIDDAGGRFAINSSTGEISVANANLINYETNSSHSVTVLASDTYTTSSNTFTIEVINETEPYVGPVDINSSADQVSENPANGTTVGITAFSENGNIPVTYSLTDDVSGRFAIDATSGVVTVKNGTLIDFEANPSYSIVIKATSDGIEKSSSFTIIVTDAAEASTGNSYSSYLYRKKLTLNAGDYVSGASDLVNFPVLLEIHDTDLKHTGSASDKVRSATANDIAFKDVSTAQSSSAELSYQIENYDAAAGVLKVWVRIPSLKKSLNNEIYMYFGSSNPTSHSSTDTWGSDYRAVFHFNENVYSTNTGSIVDGKGLNNATLTSNTNNLTTGFIGSAYSFDGSSQLIKTVSELPSTTNFTISAWVKLSNTLGADQKICSNQDGNGKGYKMGVYNDYKPESEFNPGSNFSTRDIGASTTLGVGNWYYLQTVVDGTALRTYLNGQLYRSRETTSTGTVGSYLYIGAGALNEYQGWRFYFHGSIDEFRVSSVAKSSDWIATEYNIQRYPSNIGTGLNGGAPFISSYGSLENVNSAPATPTDISSVANEVAENSDNGTQVGLTVSASDPEQNPVTYSLTDNAGGRFTINPSTGAVSVANKNLLNYEKAQSHTIIVQASDGYYTSSQSFTIAVTNIVEPLSSIEDVNAAANEISEAAAIGTVVPITAFAEHELNASVVYSLSNNAGGRFKINASTGIVSLASANLDYETATTYSITVQAFDGTTTQIESFTINLTDYYDFSSGYAFKKTITLNNNLLSLNSGLTDFPALLRIQDNNLILAENCTGTIHSSSNPDIAIIDPGNPASQLNYKIKSYNPSSGTIDVEVKIPSLTSAPKILNVYFGTDAADNSHTQAFTDATYSGVPVSPGSDWTAASATIQSDPGAYTTNGALEVIYQKAETLAGALTYTWTGTVDTDPANANNWTCTTSAESNLLPANTGKATLVIPAGLSKYPVLTASLSVYGLTIASGASLSLNGQQLNVKCNFYNNGTLLYDSNNSSALIFNGSQSTQYYYGNAVNGQVGKLEVNNTDGNVTLSGGGLDVYSLVTVSANTLNANGFLNLKASATTTAAVAPLLNGASIAGNVNAEIYFTGGGYEMRGARSFSSPVNEAQSNLSTYEQLQRSMIITGPGGASKGFDPGGGLRPNAATLTKYWEPAKITQSQFVDVADIKDPLPPGYGVFIYYRGNREGYTKETALSSHKLNAPFMDPESTAVKLEGPINQGDIKVDFTFTNNGETARDGFNLIGNPYQAVIDWEAVEKVGVGTQLVVAKPTGGFATYMKPAGSDVYVTVNADSGPYSGGTLRYIQPGLAFYAKATGPGSYVTFKENCKVVSTGSDSPAKLLSARHNDLTISIAGVEKPAVKGGSSTKILRMSLQGKSNKEESVVLFNPNFNTKAVLNEDATVFGSSTVTFSTLSSDNVRLVINAMPTATSTTIIPLNVNAESTENVKLNFNDLSAIGNAQLVLVDNYLNKTVEITAINASYPFTIDRSVAASYGTSRLKLIINPPAVLPLEAGSFVARKQNNEVKLSWTTLSENRAKEFLIEKSLNGLDFAKLDRVAAAGNSSAKKQYSLIDQQPADGINYYKLTLVNDNNESAYTALAYINYSLKNLTKISLFPNPATSILNVGVDQSYTLRSWRIIDPEGRIIKQKQVENNNMLPLDVTDLRPGVYILDLRTEGDEVIARVKFIKN